MDHEMVFPIGREHVVRMYEVPLVLEVWDQNEGGKDEFVGLVKLKLDAVPNALIEQESEEINFEALRSNQYPILVYDDCVPVKSLKTDRESGQIQLILAVGTPLQVKL